MSDRTGSPHEDEPKTAILSDVILYRGTSLGWPGNVVMQEERITCTTTDPYVATLLTIECRNHGQAVVLLVSRGPFEILIAPENWFSLIEASVNVYSCPEQFASQAFMTVSVDRCISVLDRMGFGPLPQRISEKRMLDAELNESYGLGLRLDLEQIDEFNRLITENSHVKSPD